MTTKELKKFLNTLDEKYDDYPILIFQEEKLEIMDGITHPNFGELESREDGKITPFVVLTTRSFGDFTKSYKIKINAYFTKCKEE